MLLVDRGQFAQVGHGSGDESDGCVDVLIGGEAREAEAQAGAREPVGFPSN
jgi:hypothetical protein